MKLQLNHCCMLICGQVARRFRHQSAVCCLDEQKLPQSAFFIDRLFALAHVIKLRFRPEGRVEGDDLFNDRGERCAFPI